MCARGVLETYASWAQMHVCHSCTIHFFFLHGVSNDDCFFLSQDDGEEDPVGVQAHSPRQLAGAPAVLH